MGVGKGKQAEADLGFARGCRWGEGFGSCVWTGVRVRKIGRTKQFY